jgi:hypothetical protein
MPEQITKSTQEEVDQQLATRTLSDAELLVGGAEYQNEVLKPTTKQIAEIAHEHDGTVKKVGSLILHNELEASLDVPLDAIIKQESNRRDLEDKIAQAVEPFIGIFNDKIPKPRDNKRNWRGKLDIQPTQAPEWDTKKIIGTREVVYNHSLTYTPGEATNEISNAVIRMSKKDSRYPSATLAIHYDRGTISEIEIGELSDIHYFDMRDEFTRNLLGVDQITEHSQNVAPNYDGQCDSIGKLLDATTTVGAITIKLSGESPTIDGPGFEYRFDADADEFRLVGSAADDDYYRHPVKRPMTISNDEFASIVQSALFLIPTIER